MRVAVVADVKPLLGEGPIWDVEGVRLFFIDALGRRVYRCTESGSELRAWIVPSLVGAVALWDGFALLAATARWTQPAASSAARWTSGRRRQR